MLHIAPWFAAVAAVLVGACADAPASTPIDRALTITLGHGPTARALPARVASATVDGPVVDYRLDIAGRERHVIYDLATGARRISDGAGWLDVTDGPNARFCLDAACATPLTWTGAADDPHGTAIALAGLDLIRLAPVDGLAADALPAIGRPPATASLKRAPLLCQQTGAVEEGNGCYGVTTACGNGGTGGAACYSTVCVSGDSTVLISTDNFCINF